jgi:hypothetical protein
MFKTQKPLTLIIVKPTKARNYNLIVTSGMSAVSVDSIGTEVVLGMSKEWKPPKSEEDIALLRDQDKLPVFLLMLAAEYPHLTGITLSPGHTIPMSLKELPGFSHLMTHFTMINPDFDLMELSLKKHETEAILFLGLYPITQEEFELMKKADDRDVFFDGLIDGGLSLILNPKSIYKNIL